MCGYALGTVNNLVKKVTKTADPDKISEAKGTLTAGLHKLS